MKESNSAGHPAFLAITIGFSLAVFFVIAGCGTAPKPGTATATGGSDNDEKVRLSPKSRIAVGTVIDRETALEKKDSFPVVSSGRASQATVSVGMSIASAVAGGATDTGITYTIRLRDGRTLRKNFVDDPKFRVGEEVVVNFDKKGDVKRVAVMRKAREAAELQ